MHTYMFIHFNTLLRKDYNITPGKIESFIRRHWIGNSTSKNSKWQKMKIVSTCSMHRGEWNGFNKEHLVKNYQLTISHFFRSVLIRDMSFCSMQRQVIRGLPSFRFSRMIAFILEPSRQFIIGLRQIRSVCLNCLSNTINI